LLILPISEDHRGIVAFFVMLSSLYPIAALSRAWGPTSPMTDER
jgi:hypothetical protein